MAGKNHENPQGSMGILVPYGFLDGSFQKNGDRTTWDGAKTRDV